MKTSTQQAHKIIMMLLVMVTVVSCDVFDSNDRMSPTGPDRPEELMNFWTRPGGTDFGDPQIDGEIRLSVRAGEYLYVYRTDLGVFYLVCRARQDATLHIGLMPGDTYHASRLYEGEITPGAVVLSTDGIVEVYVWPADPGIAWESVITVPHDVEIPGREKITYVAMGASDAVGVAAIPLDQGYVYKIREGLSRRVATVELVNLGLIGARIAYFVSTELPAAIAAQPDLVTIWVGVNDIQDQTPPVVFEAALETILSQLRRSTSAHIVIANIPDVTQLPVVVAAGLREAELQQLRLLVSAYNGVIMRQAMKYGAYLVDLAATDVMSNPAYISADGFHPSTAGHAAIAALFLAVIDTIF
jgi:lysophospholipase L1-like esterase